MPSLRSSASFLLVLVATLLPACGESEVPKADVEQSAMKQLSANAGKPAPQITCPGNLKAKVGTTMVCSMPLDGKPYDVKITVTAVDGKDAKYDVEVASKPHE